MQRPINQNRPNDSNAYIWIVSKIDFNFVQVQLNRTPHTFKNNKFLYFFFLLKSNVCNPIIRLFATSNTWTTNVPTINELMRSWYLRTNYYFRFASVNVCRILLFTFRLWNDNLNRNHWIFVKLCRCHYSPIKYILKLIERIDIVFIRRNLKYIFELNGFIRRGVEKVAVDQ